MVGRAVAGLLLLGLIGEGSYRLLRGAGLIRARDEVEGLGLRILLGLAAVPWLCIGMDLLAIRISTLSLGISGAGLAIAGFLVDTYIGAGARRDPVDEIRGGRPRASMRERRMSSSLGSQLLRSPAALGLAIVALSFPLLSFVHVALQPVRAYDALVGYDAVGKVMAYEGQYCSSIFTKLVFNAQCVYAPFTAGNQGFWYLFWPAVPRLWVPLTTLGFLLVLWARVRDWTASATAAGVAVFLTFTPPELCFHLTVGQTDLPSMVFVTLAIFALADRCATRSSWGAAALWVLAASTARSENMLFALALAIFAAFALRTRPVSPERRMMSARRTGGAPPIVRQRPTGSARRVAYALAVFLPAAAFFAFWNLLYVRYRLGYDPARHFRPTFELDGVRIGEVLEQVGMIVSEPGIFGELIWVLAALPLLWILGLAGRRRWFGTLPDTRAALAILVMLALGLLVYLPYFYQWDPQLNPIWTMQHTFKRGFFRFVPGLIVALVAAPPVLWLLRHCDATPHRAVAES